MNDPEVSAVRVSDRLPGSRPWIRYRPKLPTINLTGTLNGEVMNLLNMFASLAGNYQSRYLTLADRFAPPPSGGLNLRSQAGMRTIHPSAQDAYIPAQRPVGTDAPRSPVDDQPNQNGVQSSPDSDQYTPSPNSSSGSESPATYDFTRQARLDYSMTLRFDLSAMMRMTEAVAGGDTKQVEQFAAAGFGLTTDLQLDGHQTLRTKGEMSGADQGQNRNSVQNFQANALKLRTIASQDRGFQTEGFYRESSQIRRSLHTSIQGRHHLATNKLALRYRLDSGFKFAFLDRFNVQTKQMAGAESSQVGGYVDSAGAVAEQGTPEMMSAFFDAVEQYLDQSEKSMSTQTSARFRMAADELGFEGEVVDTAREKLVSTVERFFDRIEIAMDKLEEKFVPVNTSTDLSDRSTPFFSSNRFAPAMSQDSSYLTTA